MITREEYAWNRLGAAVLLKAVEDYRELCKKKKKHMTMRGQFVSLTGIERFLTTEYGKVLCITNGLDPLRMLKQLQAERKAAFEEDSI